MRQGKNFDEFMSDWRKFAPKGMVKAKTEDGELIEAVKPPERRHVWREARKSVLRDMAQTLDAVMEALDQGTASDVAKTNEFLTAVYESVLEQIGECEPPDTTL